VQRGEIERRLVERARSDPSFKELLLTNPRTAFERELGYPLPKSLSVKVVEESPTELFLVLPVDLSGVTSTAAQAAYGNFSVGEDT
jgi:hypothetical protein